MDIFLLLILFSYLCFNNHLFVRYYRVEAIKCIEILSSSWDKNTDLDNRLKVIQSLTKFVPGILSVCSIVVNATDIQHHCVTVVSELII